MLSIGFTHLTVVGLLWFPILVRLVDKLITYSLLVAEAEAAEAAQEAAQEAYDMSRAQM
jgi:hypothetical protein